MILDQLLTRLPGLLNIFSATGAAGAAIYWWRSARVELPNEFPLTVISMHHSDDEIRGAQILSSGSSEGIDNLGRAMISQSELSATAAMWACGAAGFQVGSLIAGFFVR
jgi:hypothetical protein